MNASMWSAYRALTAKILLTLPTGAEAAGEVLSFSVDEGADSPLLPGAVLSAKYTAELANDRGQWRWGGSLRGERPLVGATARLSVEIGGAEIPCGVFVVDSVSAGEGSGSVRISGSDSVASELSYAFEDGLTYPATLGEIWQHLLSRTRYVCVSELPGGEIVVDRAPDWRKASLRRAAGWIAQAAGCFVQVDRMGNLQLKKCTGGAEFALSPDDYLTLSDGFEIFGPVHQVNIAVDGLEEEIVLSDGDGAALRIEDNPLFTPENAQALGAVFLAQTSGLALTKADFRWRGDPAAGVGDRLTLTDTSGAALHCTVTSQKLTFDRGFSAVCACGVPGSGGGVARAITPEGGVNAGALVGEVNGGLLRAQSVTAGKIAAASVTAEKLAAGSVSAEKLAAGSVTAEKLAAGAVTADKLEADSVSGQVARFMTAQINAITSGEVSTSELYAAYAHLIGLAADSIDAGSVQTDRLAAQLARVVSLHAATGEFDFATIQNLVAKAMALEQGSMDTVYIKNLAVTHANMLSATLGNLVIKGDDGRYYRVFIGSRGDISAEEVTVTEGEIVAGETASGSQIVETSMNVGSLNASTLQASGAVINTIITAALDAEKITATEALIASATIPALYAVSIRALSDSLDLSANQSIQTLVGRRSAIHRSETPPDRSDVYDLWVQPSTGYTFQRVEGGEAVPSFWLDGDGTLYYSYDDGALVYPLQMDEDGVLGISDEAPFALLAGSDGLWARVKDSEWGESIDSAVNELEKQISAGYSEIVQKTDSIEASITKLVDGEELRTYMRYEDGVLALGRSDSRYTSQISDRGFVVLQDGVPMASMEQNTIAAPVIRANRMFALGEHGMRLSAGGALIIY